MEFVTKLSSNCGFSAVFVLKICHPCLIQASAAAKSSQASSAYPATRFAPRCAACSAATASRTLHACHHPSPLVVELGASSFNFEFKNVTEVRLFLFVESTRRNPTICQSRVARPTPTTTTTGKFSSVYVPDSSSEYHSLNFRRNPVLNFHTNFWFRQVSDPLDRSRWPCPPPALASRTPSPFPTRSFRFKTHTLIGALELTSRLLAVGLFFPTHIGCWASLKNSYPSFHALRVAVLLPQYATLSLP
jgi:hypothetical protein